MRRTPADRTFISVLTLGEIDQGISFLKPGDVRLPRLVRFRSQVESDFAGRILPLNEETVRLWGEISGRHRRDFGSRPAVVDTMLIATAQHRRLYVASRNTSEMRRLGWPVFNAWTDDESDFPLQL
jgi:predicted nucleic acid-binding protein